MGVKKLNEGKFRVFFDLDGGTPQTNLGRMSVEVTAKDKKEAEKLVASKFVGGMKLIKRGSTKKLKEESLKEFGLSPMDKALKQKLKDPKSGKEVTVGSIKNQGTKRYSSSLVKKANAIFKKAMEKEMATKKKIRKMQGEGIVNEKRGTCWVGYKPLGMKKKGDRMVPNCVKEI